MPLSNAHRLSRPFNIDPAYSADKPFPPRETFALSIDEAGPLNWLYGPGDLEAYLLARMKLEGFRDSKEVAHPGLFRPPATVVYFRHSITWKPSRKSCIATISHTGFFRLSINGKACLHHDAPTGFDSVRIDLARHLKPGKNDLEIIINSVGTAPTFYIDSLPLKSDGSWEVSHDGQRWNPASTRVPVIIGCPPPHLQKLPILTLKPTHIGGGVYEVHPLVVGTLAITTKKAVSIRFIAGESPEEAKSLTGAEQVTFRARTKPGQILHTPSRAFSHFTLGVKPEDIASITCHADFHPTVYRGAFASGDEQLNRIWMHSAYTLRTCARELTVDGVKRDRMPWVGDLFVSILSNATTFHDPATIRRTLVALAGLHPRQTHANGIIDYTIYWLMTLERYGWDFGDEGFVAESLGKAAEMLDALEATENAEGFLIPRPNDWLFIDWAEMKKEGAVSALQFLYIWALRSIEQLAQRLDQPELHHRVQRKRIALEKKCHATFWDLKRGAFIENFHRGKKSNSVGRHANFFAVLSGAATSTQKKSILTGVLNNSRVKAVGTPYMRFFENFARARLGDFSGMVIDVSSYWGGMLDAGATTFWEAYDPQEKGAQHHAFYGRPFGRSYCHAWASGPAYLLSQELSGLKILAPKWKQFSLTRVPETFLPLHVAMPTPHGTITVDWTKKQTLVKFPKGTEFHQRTSSGRLIRHVGPKTIRI